MINKQIASLLFKNRTDNDSITTEDQPDLKHPSTEIVTRTLDLTNQTSDSSSNTVASSLPISCQKVIQRAKGVLGKGKNLFSEFKK